MVVNMYLPLAEKLMEKYFSENEVDAEAGIDYLCVVCNKSMCTDIDF